MPHDRSRSGGLLEPWWSRRASALDQRRHELFAQAAPVFRAHGYRGATIKALAHACALSPAGLYHYFSSKRDLATYPLHHPRLDWDTTHVDPGIEPLRQVRHLVDLSIQELPTYLLALELAEQAGDRQGDRLRVRAFEEGEAVFGRVIAAVDGGMGREAATALARHLLALLAGSVFTGLETDAAEATRARMLAALRRALVPRAIDDERWDTVMVAP